MLFALLASAFLRVSLCLRPSAGVSRSASVANLGEKISAAARAAASESAEMVHEAVGIVNAIMLDTVNASEHMTDEDEKLLDEVIQMIETSIYGSMDNSHKADTAAVEAAIRAIDQCNENIEARLGEDGDLTKFHEKVTGFQQNLNNAQALVDLKDRANKSAFSKLEEHIRNIQTPPACEPLPINPTKGSFDLFFSDSQYVNWFKREEERYAPVRDDFTAADASLSDALVAYAVSLAQRDVAYCDWKMELVDGCQAHQTCYELAEFYYSITLKDELEKDMKMRIDAYEAGETIISQIKFLLGKSADSEPPTNVDTSRYELSFPDPSYPTYCGLEPLELEPQESPTWKPKPSCVLPDYKSRPPNGDCAPYQDNLPRGGEPLGNRSHTVVASVDFSDDVFEANSRMWILNIGQHGMGGHHWIFNPQNKNPPHGVLQFGTWGARFSPDQACQIRDVNLEQLKHAKVLATSYDQKSGDYCLFVDGVSIECKKCGFNIETNDLELGKNVGGGQNMRGCVRGVDVYSSALAGDQFMAAIHRLAPEADADWQA